MSFDLNEALDPSLFADEVEIDELLNEGDDFVDVQPELHGDGVHDNDENNEPVVVHGPTVGMEFDCHEEALKYYKVYGMTSGFGVVKRSNHTKGDDVCHYSFACSKHRPPPAGVDGLPIPKRRRAVVGTRCKAGITIAYCEDLDKWMVATVNSEHNHELNVGSSFLIPANRFLPQRFQKMLEYNEDQGMAIKDNIDIVTKSAGGYGRCTFTRRDARNHLDKYRRNKLRAVGGDDVVLLADFFEKRQLADRNFFYTYKHTNQGRLWNIFWADGRGIAAYKYFHEVVILDSTYLTNRYDMPLVLFVGVNHHFQTVIFACALLGKEGEEEYTWCLEKFVQCMGGVKPGGILTDQCPSIEKGIKNVLFPHTVHRYCAWHILHKLSTKWGAIENEADKIDELKDIVYRSHTPLEFQVRWDGFMDRYRHQFNDQCGEWFRSIFSFRHKWIPAHMNEQFWAGMTTTQRVESMNYFLNKYLRKKANLGEFVLRFEDALHRIWEREHEVDHESRYKKPDLYSELPMEKQFRDVYTNVMFYKCQNEFKRCVNLSSRFLLHRDGFQVYLVDDCNGQTFEVIYNHEEKVIFCRCKHFEVNGIICSHSIEVYKQERQFSIHERYIVDRWRKDISRADLMLSGSACSDTIQQNRFYELTRAANPLIEDLLNLGCVDEDAKNIVLNGLEALRISMRGEEQDEELNSNSGVVGSQSVGRGRGNSRGRGKGGSTGRGRGRSGRGRGRGRNSSSIDEEVVLDDSGFPIGVNEGINNELDGSDGSRIVQRTANEVVNCAPNIRLLPPEKSKRKGRPRKTAYKSGLDLAMRRNSQ